MLEKLNLKNAAAAFVSESARHPVSDIFLNQIDDFKNHPYRVIDDDDMEQLIVSIHENGIITPVELRNKPDGRYELISGHRRCHACRKLGLQAVPAIVKDMTDDEAVTKMVESNLYREKILPSEKAFAYKMKLAAEKRQGKRTDLTLAQLEPKSSTDSTSAQLVPKLSAATISKYDSAASVKRYIRLTYLIPELLALVDKEAEKANTGIAVNTGYALSFLSAEGQQLVLNKINAGWKISLKQAEALKKLSDEGNLTEETLNGISEKKPKHTAVDFDKSNDDSMDEFDKALSALQKNLAIREEKEKEPCRQSEDEKITITDTEPGTAAPSLSGVLNSAIKTLTTASNILSEQNDTKKQSSINEIIDYLNTMLIQLL